MAAGRFLDSGPQRVDGCAPRPRPRGHVWIPPAVSRPDLRHLQDALQRAALFRRLTHSRLATAVPGLEAAIDLCPGPALHIGKAIRRHSPLLSEATIHCFGFSVLERSRFEGAAKKSVAARGVELPLSLRIPL